MEQALINLFNFVRINVVMPINSALTGSTLFQGICDFIINFIRGLFRLWNNDNIVFGNETYLYIYSVISEAFGLLFLIFVLKLTISIFNVIFNTIRGNLK